MGDGWKAAPKEERCECEVLAAADRERFALELQILHEKDKERIAALEKASSRPIKQKPLTGETRHNLTP